MLTRCRVFRWLLATELVLEGGAEAAPVQPNQLQAVSLRPARALPLRLDQPLVRRPCLHRQICGAFGRTSPSVRSADTAEPFPGGQPVNPAPLPMGLSGPVRFLFSARSACRRIGATRCRLSPQHWLSARPSMPTRSTLSSLAPTAARYCRCRLDANPGGDHEISPVRSQLLLSVLDVTRLCLDRSLGASPRFRRSEGRKAIRLRPSCRSGHSQACRP
jgi:hypothetical protein